MSDSVKRPNKISQVVAILTFGAIFSTTIYYTYQGIRDSDDPTPQSTKKEEVNNNKD